MSTKNTNDDHQPREQSMTTENSETVELPRPVAVRSSDLLGLVTELLEMLETVEESDSGREFHPTTIQTCRCAHAAKLDEIIPKITAIVRKSPNT